MESGRGTKGKTKLTYTSLRIRETLRSSSLIFPRIVGVFASVLVTHRLPPASAIPIPTLACGGVGWAARPWSVDGEYWGIEF